MKKIASGFLVLSIYFNFFIGFAATANGQRRIVPRPSTTMKNSQTNDQEGLKFRLSEGVPGAEQRQQTPAAHSDPLSPGDSASLMKRLPPIKADADDVADFAKRAGTLPPPKTGTKIPVKFPADDQIAPPRNDTAATGALDVLRFSPEGEVGLAPDLSITFSQPMVAVTSQSQAAQVVPVEFSPAVAGQWRWLGTRTLMFDTDKRFPMATKFTARVPAGTRSATGQVLAKDVMWTFTTPPPKALQMLPANQVTRRDALMFVLFDQAIDPAAVLAKLSVTAGGKQIPVRLATEAETAADTSIAYHIKNSEAGRWLAFRALNSDGTVENALPANSVVNVSIAKGTPSAEGPLTTTAAQAFSFQTYGPLKFQKGYCGWQGNRNCDPFSNLVMEFSNSIDASKFTPEMVKIEPAVEGLKIFPAGNQIYLQGYKKGNTSYTISVDGSLADEFGQTLGQTAKAVIKVGVGQANMYAQGGAMVVLDPAARAAYSIYSTNHSNAKVRLYKVDPTMWKQYQEYRRYINYDDGKRPAIPGKLVFDKIVPIASKADEMVETRIDLSSALSEGLGNVIVDIEPTIRRDKYDRTRIFTWIQSTKIGLDAFVDNKELVGFATDLQTGKPLSGVELTIYPNGAGQVLSENTPSAAEPSYLSRAWSWLTGWGSDTSAPVPNGQETELEAIEPAQVNRTGNSGVLRLGLPESSGESQNLLIAKLGKDTAFLPENSDYYWNERGGWYQRPDTDSLRWFVFDDRKMYKPKEEVSVKGYIRRMTGGTSGDVEGLGDAASGITYSVKDPQNNEIAKGTANLNAFGAFDLKFSLPDNVNLGYSRIDLATASKYQGNVYSHTFQVQEFRRPEFEVTANVETEAPHFVGSSANVSVEAKYYAGGGLANAQTNWTVTATPTNYTPPNRGDYTFGTWVPWWGDMGYGGRPGAGSTTQNFQGVTDAAGKHLLKIDFESVEPARPYAITAAGAVQDVNRQTWSGSTALLVHPSSLYVGIKTPRTFVQKGEKIDVDTIVTDLEGNLVAGRDIEMKAVLTDYVFEKGAWVEKTVDEQTCSVRSAAEAVKCSFVAKQGGRYSITAKVMDDRERFNQSEITIWVPGGKTLPSRNVEQETVQIIPSKKEYAPGETAELLVMAPFTPAEGVLTLRREGIVKTERFSMKEGSATLKVPIEEKYLPNIYAQIDIVGSADRAEEPGQVRPAKNIAKRPAFASGNINLSVSTASRKLTVTADPAEAMVAPGGSTKVKVAVKDDRGEPVANSEVALVIVDESILSLTQYSIADPMSVFYSQRGAGVNDHHLRKDIVLGNPEDVGAPPKPMPPPSEESSADKADGVLYEREAKMVSRLPSASPMAMMADGAGSQPEAPINLRENFNALALFSPSVRTDSNGNASVDVKLPDNLTRYRITAVSVDQAKRFGKAESNITARQPLMVRPSAPRFMNFGDKIELPVVIQNQTDKDMTVDVAIRATNADLVGIDGSAGVAQTGKKLVVKANDRAEVRFPVNAAKAGTARFQFAAVAGSYSDAAEISLPVWTPATTEAFATYGTTDQNGAIVQPVQTPGEVWPQFGGLEVTTSSTQLQELTDAYIYLARYPYECTEQISSRMISTAALRDVLNAFKAKDMPTAPELEARFARDLEILRSRQRSDGSFGLWKRDRERYEYPFVTLHAALAMASAKQKGYKVPDDMINRTKPYLKNVEAQMKNEWYIKSPSIRWTISAYALYIRDLMGDKDIAKTKALLAEATVEKMPFEALGWVLSVLAKDPGSTAEVDSIKRFLMNRTTETAAAANFVTDYGDGAWLIMYSNRRADGVLLEALIKADPANDLIPKLVRGLLDHRVKGAWSNTQENVFILLAMDKYFQAFEKVTPDFVTRVWLGNTYAGEQAFKGRSVDSNVLNIPMSYLVGSEEKTGSSSADLILDKQGAGRLYYRIGMKYAPKSLKLDPADYGFSVIRKYEAVDDPADVKQNADGSWTFKAGARVRVRLTMVAQARRYHVALVDNLPAGLEILNPGLAVTESIPPDTGGGNTNVTTIGDRMIGRNSYWYRANWFEHQNFRDERAEAFTALLWEGVYNYTYVTRATTPGQFVVPPAKAEEMYHPETFGRSGTDTVNVE